VHTAATAHVGAQGDPDFDHREGLRLEKDVAGRSPAASTLSSMTVKEPGMSCSRPALPGETEECVDVFVREGPRLVKPPDRRRHTLSRAEPRIGGRNVPLDRRDDNVQCAEIAIFHGSLDVRVNGPVGIGT
jgi:hypothetical protein